MKGHMMMVVVVVVMMTCCSINVNAVQPAHIHTKRDKTTLMASAISKNARFEADAKNGFALIVQGMIVAKEPVGGVSFEQIEGALKKIGVDGKLDQFISDHNKQIESAQKADAARLALQFIRYQDSAAGQSVGSSGGNAADLDLTGIIRTRNTKAGASQVAGGVLNLATLMMDVALRVFTTLSSKEFAKLYAQARFDGYLASFDPQNLKVENENKHIVAAEKRCGTAALQVLEPYLSLAHRFKLIYQDAKKDLPGHMWMYLFALRILYRGGEEWPSTIGTAPDALKFIETSKHFVCGLEGWVCAKNKHISGKSESSGANVCKTYHCHEGFRVVRDAMKLMLDGILVRIHERVTGKDLKANIKRVVNSKLPSVQEQCFSADSAKETELEELREKIESGRTIYWHDNIYHWTPELLRKEHKALYEKSVQNEKQNRLTGKRTKTLLTKSPLEKSKLPQLVRGKRSSGKSTSK